MLLLLGCNSWLDRVDILAGERCSADREEYVWCGLDGDTIKVGESCDLGESIRMLGVDAPEIAHSETEVAECYGPEAASWTASMLEGEDIRLEFDTVCTDAYERTLAYVWWPGPNILSSSDGEDVLLNERIIRDGYAEVYEDFDDIRWAPILYDAQASATASGRGLWSACK
jgi:micrococcal nuclease